MDGVVLCQRLIRSHAIRRKNTSKTEMLQKLVEQYRKIHKVSSVNVNDVAAWAIRTKAYEPQPSSRMRLLAREISHALREVFFTDSQGRRVRKKHAQRILKEGKCEQMVLWHDITEASRPQMQAAFQQRRHGVVMDCRQLKIDVDSYNENYNRSVTIQMCFDFEEDLLDLEHEDGDS